MEKLSEQQARISKLADPYKEIRERQERLNEAFVSRTPDLFKEVRERQERMSMAFAARTPDLFKEVRERQERMSMAFASRTPDLFKEVHERQKRWLSAYDQSFNVLVEDVEALEGGLFSVSGEVIDGEHIQQDIISISEDSENQEQFLDHLIAWYDRQSRGAQILVAFVLYPIILEVFFYVTPLTIDFVNDHTHLTQKEAVPEIVRDANEIFTPSELHGHRFTTASKLNVRLGGNKQSEIANILQFGTPVRVLESSNGWSYIEYRNPETDVLQNGWVSSRYLRSFNK